ncbi:hypothetical protein ABZT45_11210 [Streptomyces sp. NPDC005356]|uniref:hypothetical protein n=1 Tax=Streptomyces sp. NPDC005356 TaxID=3157167 RepID=UPI0033BA511A
MISTGPLSRTALSRVTLAGARRRVERVLPSRAPLGVLLPDVRPAESVRLRLRRVGAVLESVGVIALLPLVIGVFGVYGRLLGTFA